jgi:PII-like signaling protein
MIAGRRTSQLKSRTAARYGGHSSHLHTAKILPLSMDLPLVIEIVDAEEKINAFLPSLDEMMSSGLVTLEKVQVLQYGAKDKADRRSAIAL